MKRRGFLGALTAAIAASRVLPAKASDEMPNAWEVLHNYEHRGLSIVMPDKECEHITQHLGQHGKLVAITFPNGVTHKFLSK